MSRQVPVDQPLSDEDREYLHARGLHAQVDMIDSRNAGAEDGEDALGDDEPEDPAYEAWLGPELEAELRRRGLPYSGKNEERVARLRAHDAQQQP